MVSATGDPASSDSSGCTPSAEPHFSLFASDPSKAYFERFSLVWSPISLCILLVGLFGTGAWRQCGRDEYLAVSISLCLPGIVWPILFPCAADKGKPYAERFWVKAAVWIAIFSFYGNYFWTHYFYSLLGAKYLFDSYLLNDVPVVTYFCTYFYFTAYFSVTNIVQRICHWAVRPLARSRSKAWRLVATFLVALSVFTLSVATAVFEAVSIQHFPLYTYTDRTAFLTIGSVVYGIYFMVGFPMFFAIDEKPIADHEVNSVQNRADDARKANRNPVLKKQPSQGPSANRSSASMWAVTQNSLAAVALVTLVLDLWRLVIGDIYGFRGGAIKVPFIYQQKEISTRLVPNALPNMVSRLSLHSEPARANFLRLFGRRPTHVVGHAVRRLRHLVMPPPPSRFAGLLSLLDGLYEEVSRMRRFVF